MFELDFARCDLGTFVLYNSQTTDQTRFGINEWGLPNRPLRGAAVVQVSINIQIEV